MPNAASTLSLICALLIAAPLHAEGSCTKRTPAVEIQSNLAASIDAFNATHQRVETALKAEIERKTQELLSRGTWDEEKKRAAFARIAAEPAFVELQAAAAEALKHLNASLFTLQDRDGAKFFDLCKVADDALASLRKLTASNEAQWRFILQRLDDELRDSGGG
jgi:hypothetical protein